MKIMNKEIMEDSNYADKEIMEANYADKEIMEANYADKEIDEVLATIDFNDFSSEIDWDFNNKNTTNITATTDDGNFERVLSSEENKWTSYLNVQQFIGTSSDFPTMDAAGFNNNNNNNEDYVSRIENFLLG
ncbi:uncharacterized protein [Spinacia oleracea]|uniref:Uncharacterized protein n=1 Tax=Spinacia oleracea TaxID=3562 RepID=A0ABM3R5U2_SPIOL|nr:uncharacterized protein LOC130466248 [Spinacia oleracea]